MDRSLHRRWLLAGFLLVTAGLLVPFASAQGSPTAEVRIQELPVAPVEKVGASLVQPFKVGLTLSNLLCPMEQAFPVNLSATVAQEGNATYNLTFIPGPTLSFSVPPQQYVSGTYSEILPAAIQVEGNSLPVGEYNLTVQVTARYPGTNQGCQGASSLPERSHSAGFDVVFDVGVPEGLPVSPAMPFPPVGGVLGVLLIAFVLRRRFGDGST